MLTKSNFTLLMGCIFENMSEIGNFEDVVASRPIERNTINRKPSFLGLDADDRINFKIEIEFLKIWFLFEASSSSLDTDRNDHELMFQAELHLKDAHFDYETYQSTAMRIKTIAKSLILKDIRTTKVIY